MRDAANDNVQGRKKESERMASLAETVVDAFGYTGIVVCCPICDGTGIIHITKETCGSCAGWGWCCEGDGVLH